MYSPYMGNMQAFQQDQIALQERINQLEAMRRPQQLQTNVNWIQVAGIEGARNQIVQPNQTAWMMDNNNPYFYVKSVDGMGSATLKMFSFQEIPQDTVKVTQNTPIMNNEEYVTRKEFNELLSKLGETEDNYNGKSLTSDDGKK